MKFHLTWVINFTVYDFPPTLTVAVEWQLCYWLREWQRWLERGIDAVMETEKMWNSNLFLVSSVYLDVIHFSTSKLSLSLALTLFLTRFRPQHSSKEFSWKWNEVRKNSETRGRVKMANSDEMELDLITTTPQEKEEKGGWNIKEAGWALAKKAWRFSKNKANSPRSRIRKRLIFFIIHRANEKRRRNCFKNVQLIQL